MATEFQELPIIDLSLLSGSSLSFDNPNVKKLASQLCEAFETVGFAYLVNLPLSYKHEEVFRMAKKFFALSEAEKLIATKKAYRKENSNTYRGYFPAQPGKKSYKEGFELGPPGKGTDASPEKLIDITEQNVFPPESEAFPASLRKDMETFYSQLDSLARRILSLLAVGLGKQQDAFDSLVVDSVSTLRFLHYPIIARSRWNDSAATSPTKLTHDEVEEEELSLGPHADSGLLTLLHQDTTGGLEVLNSAGKWIHAPYVPSSIVINIGDVMADLSGKKFVATQHRVKSCGEKARYSVPFFFEPGVDAAVPAKGKEMRYEDFVLEKMATWVEYNEVDKEE